MRIGSLLLMAFLLICAQVSWADYTEGLHLDWLNKKINPADNFYDYANGGWTRKNAIPPAYGRWSVFHLLDEKNKLRIKAIIETAESSPNTPGSNAQKIADFYRSGMDVVAIYRAGLKPIQPEFDRIGAIKNLTDLQDVMAYFQTIGVETLFGVGQMQDYEDSSKVIGVVMQSGIGLPDRDYYLKSQFQPIRDAYRQHVANMFVLLGDAQALAKVEAIKVLFIETLLAKASMPKIDQRDPHNIYHMYNLTQLQQLTSDFDWAHYFANLNHPEIQQVNVATPDYFKVMNSMLTAVSLSDWQIYFRWHVIDAFSPYLSSAFVNEDFHMATVLTGAKELQPRWKRVIGAENGALGFVIGKRYVAQYFPLSSKRKVKNIVSDIREALKKDLQHLPWMTPATRTEALKKLDHMVDRLGYPDKWLDYSKLKIDRGSYVLNIIRADQFLFARELNKIGKPLDRTEWGMLPQEVNAYYDPSMNNLNLPAGILQSPFFDAHAPAAVNYASIGFVIGHEMTHGFDDEGAQFDENGNLKNWWTAADLEKFHAKTNCVSDQFSQYTVAGSVHVQGKLVTGEAVADLGGLSLAYRAFHASQSYPQATPIAGFTPDQQFYLGAAHVWAMNIRREEAIRLVTIDPHPPANYRVNGTLANMPGFQMAYAVKGQSPMINQAQCAIW